MSVSPNEPMNLPRHRLPIEFDGTGKDPVWMIGEYDLNDKLTYRPDPADPETHGFVEPSEIMPFDEYQAALYNTRLHWVRVVKG